jgi:hypothetical protein
MWLIRAKKLAYEAIAEKLSSVGPVRRSGSQVKRKRENLFSSAKKKVNFVYFCIPSIVKIRLVYR